MYQNITDRSQDMDYYCLKACDTPLKLEAGIAMNLRPIIQPQVAF